MPMRDLQGQAERPLHYRARPAMEVGLLRDRQARDGRGPALQGLRRARPQRRSDYRDYPWLDSTKDDEEAMRVLGEHRVPFAPVLTVEQAMNHPHLRARRTVRTIKDRFLGEFNVPGFPLRFW